MATAQLLASIPSPTQSVWHLGPFPLRAYALCIIAGIGVALWVTARRWRERGGDPDHLWDVSGWAILFGIVGGRLYHVATDPELYFADGKHPIDALKIWDGGLGIWGAIALGGVGAWIGCRRKGIRLVVFADACVPGVIFAQAIGRLGNWFNNELYGARTDLPWGLEIHDLSIESGRSSSAIIGTFQPTFLYELIWDVAVGVALILLDRRLRLGRGNVLALYVMGYTLGRVWIEMLRTDTANHILGIRLNVFTSVIVFVGGLVYFLTHGGFRAQREASPYVKDDAVADAGAGDDASGRPAEPEPSTVPGDVPSTVATDATTEAATDASTDRRRDD